MSRIENSPKNGGACGRHAGRSQELPNKLCEKMRQGGYKAFERRRAKELVCELQQAGIDVGGFTKVLSGRVAAKQDYMDIYVEGRFAVTLSRNGFSEVDLEWCRKGPDIRAKYNRQRLYFEVTRRRPKGDEWAQSKERSGAGTDEVPPDSTEDVVSKIKDKLEQLKAGAINFVVYWSSTVRVTCREFEDAVTCLRKKIGWAPELYRNLSGVVFTEMEGIEYPSLKQYHVFVNDTACRRVGTRLKSKVESLHSRPIRELKNEQRGLELALERLKRERIVP